MFYCVTDSLEFEVRVVSVSLDRCHFGVLIHTYCNIMVKHSMYYRYSATFLTTVAVMLQAVRLCSLTKVVLKHFDRAPCTTQNRFEVSKHNQN